MNTFTGNGKSQERPRIEPPKQLVDRLLYVLGWIALAGLWTYAVYAVSGPPETMPPYPGVEGAPADDTSNYSLLILPGIATFIFLVMTLLSWFPHIFNYAVKITPANAAYQYRLVIRFLQVEKLMVLLVLAMIIRLSVRSAEDPSGQPETFTLFAVMGLLLAPVLIYLFLSLNHKTQAA